MNVLFITDAIFEQVNMDELVCDRKFQSPANLFRKTRQFEKQRMILTDVRIAVKYQVAPAEIVGVW